MIDLLAHRWPDTPEDEGPARRLQGDTLKRLGWHDLTPQDWRGIDIGFDELAETDATSAATGAGAHRIRAAISGDDSTVGGR